MPFYVMGPMNKSRESSGASAIKWVVACGRFAMDECGQTRYQEIEARVRKEHDWEAITKEIVG